MPFLSVFPTLQAEIVKRLNGICAQVLPYLSQEVTAWLRGVGSRERGPVHADPGSSAPLPCGISHSEEGLALSPSRPPGRAVCPSVPLVQMAPYGSCGLSSSAPLTIVADGLLSPSGGINWEG